MGFRATRDVAFRESLKKKRILWSPHTWGQQGVTLLRKPAGIEEWVRVGGSAPEQKEYAFKSALSILVIFNVIKRHTLYIILLKLNHSIIMLGYL